MMSQYQQDIVKMVYNRFLDSEESNWTDIDCNLEFFDFLSDEEVVNESKIRCQAHTKTGIRCSQDHLKEFCFAPYVLESVDAILDLYKKSKNLHPKNRYILVYYLTMSELQMIYSI